MDQHARRGMGHQSLKPRAHAVAARGAARDGHQAHARRQKGHVVRVQHHDDGPKAGQGQQRIKSEMPEVYATIQRYAAKDKTVWRLVRLGLTGKPDCFWASERGFVVGAPFTRFAKAVEVSRLMARFGCAHVCMIAGHGDLGGA